MSASHISSQFERQSPTGSSGFEFHNRCEVTLKPDSNTFSVKLIPHFLQIGGVSQ